MRAQLILASAALAAACGLVRADVSIQSNDATVSPAAVYQPGTTGLTTSWFNSTNLSNATIPYSSALTSGMGSLLTDGTFSSGSFGYTAPNNVNQLRSLFWGFRPLNGSTNGVGLGASPGGIGTLTNSPTVIAQGTSSATVNFSNVQLGTDALPTYKFSVANNISVSRPGSGQALVTNAITITNTAPTATQTLQFFLMVDSQLRANSSGDGNNDSLGALTGTLDADGRRLIQFQDTSFTNPATGSGAAFLTFGALNPDAWEAGAEAAVGSNIRTKLAASSNGTNNQLTSSITYPGSDPAGPFGAYTWTVTLAPGESRTFTGYVGLNSALAPVPEPASLGLLAGAALLGLRRRRA